MHNRHKMDTFRALHRLRQLESGNSQFSYKEDEEFALCSRAPFSCSPSHVPTSPQLSVSFIGSRLNSCKRRIDFGDDCEARPPPHQLKMRAGRGKYQTPAVLRRNERERNRVSMVNTGFHTLRQHVPQVADNQKISKVDTLRAAVEYIKQLQNILGKDNTPLLDATSPASSVVSSKKCCKSLPSSCSSSPAFERTSSFTACSDSDSRSADDQALDAYENELADLSDWLH